MSRVKVSICQSCQRWINAKHEDWEIIKKSKVELIKDLNCEHGTNVIDYYDDQGDHVFERTPKNFHESCCSTCIGPQGWPDKVIFKENGWGDEWRDNNHVCRDSRNPEISCPESSSCITIKIIEPCADCGQTKQIIKCTIHKTENVDKQFPHYCKGQHNSPSFNPQQTPTNWPAIILNGFFILLPFLLIFLVIRWLWRKGSKK